MEAVRGVKERWLVLLSWWVPLSYLLGGREMKSLRRLTISLMKSELCMSRVVAFSQVG